MALPLAPLLLAFAASQGSANSTSGGVLKIEQAAYDVLSYDIAIRVDPATRTFAGTTLIEAKTVIPTASIVLDLDSRLTVSELTDGANPLRYDRSAKEIRVHFPRSKQPGDPIRLEIAYQGAPQVARNAPWDGGVVWAKTPGGADWISVALQGDGADLIFPCKDHPSDRPDKAMMRLTVPDPLIAVGPGKLEKTEKHPDKTTTYVWNMPLPINNYSLVFNAAPYELVKDTIRSVGGQTVPIHFYIVPEEKDKAAKLIEEQKKYFHFMEKFCGPFPFRSVKVGIVHTPHLGMEHSTSIAYGNRFRFADDGYDWLLLHEFGHEWWANLVANADWRDMWIHEGFQSFMDTFYLEQIRGKDAYFNAMRGRRRSIRNAAPVAPRAETNSGAYGGDIYDKGALVLHSLRFLIGEGAFLKSIRRMAYPTPEAEKWIDGRALRLVTTDDFVNIASEEAKQDLRWFFEVYLRQPKLPTLRSESADGVLQLEWIVPDNLSFPMPVEVVVDGKSIRVPMTGGKGSVRFTGNAPVVDPNGWVLKG